MKLTIESSRNTQLMPVINKKKKTSIKKSNKSPIKLEISKSASKINRIDALLLSK